MSLLKDFFCILVLYIGTPGSFKLADGFCSYKLLRDANTISQNLLSPTIYMHLSLINQWEASFESFRVSSVIFFSTKTQMFVPTV